MNKRIFLNNDWSYSPSFDEAMTKSDYIGKFDTVRLPHTVSVTPFNDFTPEVYQMVSAYRRTFKTESAWAGCNVLLTIEAAAHQSEVFLNGKRLAEHKCGYTAFTVDLTAALAAAGQENVLLIKVDSRENINQPPFGNLIDYMTYGGIYREVYMDIKPSVYIQDVFVMTHGTSLKTEVTLNSDCEGYKIKQTVKEANKDSCVVIVENTADVNSKTLKTQAEASAAKLWSLEEPNLYTLKTELIAPDGTTADTFSVRFGFRDIVFNKDGFFLNNKKIKLRGLNRHQSWAYIGYAMPKNMQREDADILKYELGLNEVRTSHYPQSHYFIDRCDEIGLLVFTEFPGWQYIGNAEWKDIAVENAREMVSQYRNHPSVFMWGVRINESPDDDEFYQRTNAVAHALDPTRPTAGVRNFKNSKFYEDVYTYNDFSHTGDNEGTRPKAEITKSEGGYMVTEYNGHMYPTKSFDDEWHRMKHALRHARVLDSVAGRDDTGGSSGWCAFDYNTHKEFGSGDYICYHGVMDMFRNPKLAAAVYKSQQDAAVVGDVLEISSSMDVGEYPAGTREAVWMFTNADSVKLYVNDEFVKEYFTKDSPYSHLSNGPILIDDFIGPRLAKDYNLPESEADKIKKVLHGILQHGYDKLFDEEKQVLDSLLAQKKVTEAQLWEYFSRYLGNLGAGGTVTTSFRFEAYRNGKLVKTVVKMPAKHVAIKAEPSHTELKEETTYDVAAVRIRAMDENGNQHPYCQEAMLLKAEGAIEIIGPTLVSLKGGSAGTYVKTIGKSGKGTLSITDWLGRETKIDFTVTVE